MGPRLDLQRMLADPGCKDLLNPSVHMTWVDEDFIGRVSRICRRTHALTAPSRCIDRALGHYRRQWSSVFGPNYLHRWELGKKKSFVLSSMSSIVFECGGEMLDLESFLGVREFFLISYWKYIYRRVFFCYPNLDVDWISRYTYSSTIDTEPHWLEAIQMYPKLFHLLYHGLLKYTL